MSMNHVQRVRSLYKTILTLHKGLPKELRALGNGYARDEFKRHKNCKPEEALIFMNEWTNYGITIAKQLGLEGATIQQPDLGRPLNQEELELFKGEQIHQLYELMVATHGDKQGTKKRKT